MATSKKAESPQEFFDKYQHKRYNAENAGLSVILEYLYQCYVSLLQHDYGEVPAEHLYHKDRKREILAKAMESARGSMLIGGMQNLTYWLVAMHDMAYSTTASARLALQAADEDVYRILRSNLLEKLKTHIQELGDNIAKLADMEAPIPIDISPFAEDAENIILGSKDSFHENAMFAENQLRFVHSFNTLIGMIGEALKIPEFDIIKVSTATMDQDRKALNEALDRYTAETGEILLAPNNPHMEYPPDPIPEENIKSATECIERAIWNGYNWNDALRALNYQYWWRTLE